MVLVSLGRPCYDKKPMMIANLVETTWLVQYLWPVEILHDQGKEFLGHNFEIILVDQEYSIKMKPTSLGNP